MMLQCCLQHSHNTSKATLNALEEGPNSVDPDAGFFYLGDLTHTHARSVDNGSAQYVGEWLAESRHGVGSLLRDDGGRYDGSWVDDKQSGSGRERLPGSTYTGSFKDGKRHGVAVMSPALRAPPLAVA